MGLVDDVKIYVSLIGSAFDCHGQVQYELAYLVSIYTDFATINHRNIQIVIPSFFHVHIAGAGSAGPCDWLAGQEFVGDARDHFIQVTGVKLEESGLPTMPV